MKVFLLLCVFAAQAFGFAVDLKGVKPGWQRPEMLATLAQLYPEINLQEKISSWNSRIVNGNSANPNQFPFLASNFFQVSDGIYFCGASIISVNYVLTAAHCTDGAVQFYIDLGAHDVTAESEPNRVTITSTTATIHPSWNWDTLENDIAVIRLGSPATLNQYVSTISLPTVAQESQDFADVLATAIGWGATVNGGGISPTVNYVSNPILSPSACSAYIGTMTGIICFSGANGRDICNGDSGGPLTVNDDQGITRLVGVTSFYINSCGSAQPSGFSRVTFFAPWIRQNTDVTL